MQDVASIQAKFEALRPYLDERRRRLWAAAEAMVLGRGGITAVATATGLQRKTIRVGIHELQASPTTETEAVAADRVQRVRAPGGGRKPLTTEDPTHPGAGPGNTGGTDHSRRPDVTVALDL